MTQYDYGVIDPSTTSGSALAAALSSFRDAVLTQHSGSGRPAYIKVGQLWLDTSGASWLWKLWDGADDILVGTVNPSTNTFTPANVDQPQDISSSATGLTLNSASNNLTYVFTGASATVAIAAASGLPTGWHATIVARGGDVTIDPNASEQIDGATTLIIPKGTRATIFKSGSAFTSTKERDVVTILPSYIRGLITTKTAAFTISVASGTICGNNKLVTNGGAFSKNLNAVWAAGSGSGGMMSAGSIAANTTYHLHALIKNSDGSFDWGYDLSATAPTIPTGYTWVGRIWSIYVNTALTAIADYTQIGDTCVYPGIQWFSTTATLPGGLYTVPVNIPMPTGIVVKAKTIMVCASAPNGSVDLTLGDTLTSDAAVRCIAFTAGGSANGATTASAGTVLTNSGRQIVLSAILGGSGGAATLNLTGWEDFTLNRVY